MFYFSYGNYLRVESDGSVSAGSGVLGDNTGWLLHKANVPYLPKWLYTRPNISASTLLPNFEKYNMDSSSGYDYSKINGLESAKKQEKLLIEELLYALLSIDGT